MRGMVRFTRCLCLCCGTQAQALADAITGHAQFVGLSLDTTGIEAAGAEALAAAIDGTTTDRFCSPRLLDMVVHTS